MVKQSRTKLKRNDVIKKPKCYISDYNFFSRAFRVQLSQQYPHYSTNEINRLIGQKWKEMDKFEKQPYEELANQDKERYLQEVAAFNSTWPDMAVIPRINTPSGEVVAGVSLPRPRTAFNLFVSQEKNFVAALGNSELSKKMSKYISKRWKTMEESERELYFAMARHEAMEIRQKFEENNMMMKE